jgi:uncharacterized membrane protein
VLGVVAGLSVASTLFVLVHSEARTLRDEQQVCQIEQQDRRIDRMIAVSAHLRIVIPATASGCS